MRLHHLALRTRQLRALEAFYAGLLGLRVVRRSPSKASGAPSGELPDERVWLASGDAVIMLERAEPHEPRIAADSQELIAFAVEPPDARALEGRLAAAGVPIEARTEHTIYFRDPDGRRVGASDYPLAIHIGPLRP